MRTVAMSSTTAMVMRCAAGDLRVSYDAPLIDSPVPDRLRTKNSRLSRASSTDGFGRDRGLFSADLFHPSSAGYAVIAGALAPTVRAVARERAVSPAG
ncbi:hypothetical protein ADL15_03275 [Actinoplanes awajinensis subsp. mycoplanecinus]|uniref:SGNH hydrolase-type esterase domain-containing protein n=2 Tax=Actinoplanes awajinensis TaxID=135946 RepID=A0A0X3VAK6_9ACTN|nr:hypothetical protein ADL15_03275 [Actinoplanes awajinensis subsp. mycoplanecinus]